MADPDTVFTGVWRNWELGTWSSLTVTIPATQGLYLVSFLTLFVRWSGSNLWSILAFGMHQWRSTPEPRDGLHHQQQVILRNNAGSTSVLWMVAKLTWRWKDRADRVWLRGLKLATPTALSVGAIAAAAFLSSQILTPSDFVVPQSGLPCGWFADAEFFVDSIHADDILNQRSDTLYVSAVSTIQKAAEYTAACYERQTNEYSSLCSTYVARNIPATANTTASCPFGATTPSICSTPALQLDSGFISAASHLGINISPDQDVSFRKVTTCAPFSLDKYASDWQTWQDGPEKDPGGIYQSSLWKYYNIFQNKTFSIKYSNDSAFWSPLGYQLGVSAIFDGDSPEARYFSDVPVEPELTTRTGDQLLILLQNLAMYSDPVTDPWFNATSQNDTRGYYSNTSWEQSGAYFPSSMSSGAYFPSAVASGLGCTETYQFCANHICTPPSGLYPSQNSTLLSLTPRQEAVHKVLWKSIWAANFFLIVNFLRDDVLLAKRLLHPSLISAPVPENQWMLEAQNLHNLSMAVIQRRVVEFSRPPNFQIRPGVETARFIVPPATEEEREICYNVKTRNSVYRSFSLATLLAVIVAGLVVEAVNLGLPGLVFWLRGRKGERDYRTREWIGGHVLQVQRGVLERDGVGPWEGDEQEIPVLVDGKTVFTLGEEEVVVVEDGKGGGKRSVEGDGGDGKGKVDDNAEGEVEAKNVQEKALLPTSE
ncbi:hypothetical protein B0T16DRAFT_496125 [Cercophora newfieldiana]|uniref:Uncharacterized protein n=1 Tax=Cercophora newfieldiana TaxID=92897 RepID=A0AA39XYM1_9PEZI|nr:hypothetical protein B0T16DRAFT_496125 [Cercophora newfieldiana]